MIYRSGGLRVNPNLYECGKVCLSLLNTWTGAECERWNPANSTLLQVLVSIQALVLNAKPYFNEPGYAMYANTPQGARAAMEYNEEVFLLSCRTMQYSIHNPPKVWRYVCSVDVCTNVFKGTMVFNNLRLLWRRMFLGAFVEQETSQ